METNISREILEVCIEIKSLMMVLSKWWSLRPNGRAEAWYQYLSTGLQKYNTSSHLISYIWSDSPL